MDAFSEHDQRPGDPGRNQGHYMHTLGREVPTDYSRKEPTMPDLKWHETHDNLVGLAGWLDSECASFSDVAAAIYFFEKPWKWDREYDLWQLWAKAETPGFRERCIDAVADEITAEQLLAEEEESARA